MDFETYKKWTRETAVYPKELEEEYLIKPVDVKWKSALISIAKNNTAARRFVIELGVLNRKCKWINLSIRSVEQNLWKLHGATLFCIYYAQPRFLDFYVITQWMGKFYSISQNIYGSKIWLLASP